VGEDPVGEASREHTFGATTTDAEEVARPVEGAAPDEF